MNEIEMYGYSTMDSLGKMRFIEPSQYAVTKQQLPVKRMVFPTVYDHPLKNYWWKSPKKIKKYFRIKITVEVLQ